MVKNRYRAIAFVLMFCFACLVRPAYPQDSDSEILVKGDPPLTSLMAGKVIVLLDWALELKLANENKLEIKKNLIRTWQSGVKSEMQGALELIDIYEKVYKMSEPDRNAARGKLHDLILQSLRSEPDDALAKMLLSAYDASRGKAVKAPAGAEAASPPSAASNIGADGFTGIYRMVRPRTISLTGGSSGSGVWIEYVTFLPDGHLYWSLPPEGLLYFNPDVAKRAHPDDWGTYQIRNSEIYIERGPERRPYVMTRAGDRLNNPASLGKGTFRPVPSADGLRLEGSYRRADTEPGITFTADGTFRDGGVFGYFGTRQRPDGSIYPDDGKGGAGTYFIRQNTLELKYSDGRVKRAPFIAFPENIAKAPAVDSFILFREESMKRF